jgi:hypothetical protein
MRMTTTLGLSAIALATMLAAQPADAASPACATRNNNTVKNLLECVTLDGVRAHQAALQAIADANNGIRTSGTPGYDASVAYVVGKLEAAGYHRDRAGVPVPDLHPALADHPRAGDRRRRPGRSRTPSSPIPAAATSRRRDAP